METNQIIKELSQVTLEEVWQDYDELHYHNLHQCQTCLLIEWTADFKPCDDCKYHF